MTPRRLKALAELKADTLINCEYCLDIGSALAQAVGETEAQVRTLLRPSGFSDGAVCAVPER